MLLFYFLAASADVCSKTKLGFCDKQTKTFQERTSR